MRLKFLRNVSRHNELWDNRPILNPAEEKSLSKRLRRPANSSLAYPPPELSATEIFGFSSSAPF